MNLESILKPFPGPLVCGEDMSFSPEFDVIAEARRFDDPLLGQGEWVTPIKEADWPAVVSLCSSLLETRSKDLRLAVWLVEGLARTAGIGGLAKGYALLSRLCEVFWDDIHPLAEEGDLAMRAGCLRWLLSQSPGIIRELPIALETEVWEALDRADVFAPVHGRNPHQREVHLCAVLSIFDDLDSPLRDGLSVVLQDGLKGAQQALISLDQLQGILEPRLAQDGPGFEATRGALQDLVRKLEQVILPALGIKQGGDTDWSRKGLAEEVRPSPRIDDVSLQAGGDGYSTRGITDRASALAQLREVAAYFRRAEPHSPVAYLADKAARWGEMSLHEWLAAVVKDGSALAGIEEALGVEGEQGRRAASG